MAVDWKGSGVGSGFDRRIGGNTLVGVGAFYTSSDVTLNDQGNSRGRVSTPQVMTYTGVTEGALQLRGVLGFALNDYESERSVTLGRGITQVSGRHTAQEW